MKAMKNFLAAILGITLIIVSAACSGNSGSGSVENGEWKGKPAKYVFVFIGDGMGLPQINAAETFLAAKAGDATDQDLLNFSAFPAQGLTTTMANDRFITGSAASATAISTGKKTNIGVIAMDPTASSNYETIAERASAAGMKVGIISSVDLDHATPAAFYAHQPTRNNYYKIGVEAANSKVNYFGGGRFRLSKTPAGEPNQHELFSQNGWTLADNRTDMNAIKAGTDKVYAYNYGFASDALDYDIDRKDESISLAEFTAKGIELLDNEKGFFIMVEGGKIDWACHANDAASAIQDTLAFAAAVQEAVDFYNAHPDETLIVVTGDHECGGLSLGFAGTGYATAFEMIATQKNSHEYFDEYILKDYLAKGGNLEGLLPRIKEYFGLDNFSDYEMSMLTKAFARTVSGDDEKSSDEDFLLYGGYTPITMQLTHMVANRAGLSWTSYTHTGVPVPTFALGAGAPLFDGYYDNTDIYHKTVEAMDL